MSSFGKILKKLRERENLTQEELADKLGVKNRSSIANWEADRIAPDYTTVKKIANLFDVTVDYLLGNNYDSNSSEVTISKADIDFLKILRALPLDKQDDIETMTRVLYDKFIKSRG